MINPQSQRSRHAQSEGREGGCEEEDKGARENKGRTVDVTTTTTTMIKPAEVVVSKPVAKEDKKPKNAFAALIDSDDD